MPIRIDTALDAFAIIDCQPAFMPGGSLPTPDGEAVVAVINRLVRLPFAFRFATQDWHPRGQISFASSQGELKPLDEIALQEGPLTLWPDPAVKGTNEAALHPALEATLVDLIIRKGTSAGLEGLSAFSDRGRRAKSDLASMLRERGIERLFLAGLAMDVCVAATAEDAIQEGFTVVLIEDACRPSKPDALDATRSRLGRMNVGLVSERELSC